LALFTPTPPPFSSQPHENNRVTSKKLHLALRNKGLTRRVARVSAAKTTNLYFPTTCKIRRKYVLYARIGTATELLVVFATLGTISTSQPY
jgi:hypothetical protein